MSETRPKIASSGDLPPETRKAAYEMVAHALRHQTPLATITLHDVSYEGKPIGDYEISIRKID